MNEQKTHMQRFVGNDALNAPSKPDVADETLLCQHILQRLGEGGQPPEFGLGRINVGNESYLKVLEHEYFGRHLRLGASFKLVQGYFGGGKTHFLYCVRELAWRWGFVTAVVELSPGECPYDDSVKVYRAVARRIGLEPESFQARGDFGLPGLLRRVIEARLGGPVELSDPEDRDSVAAWLGQTVRRSPCESHSFRQAVVTYCRALLRGDEAVESLLGAWLSGEAAPPAELREVGVYEVIDKSNGFTMLRCLTQMIVGLELPGTVLLFDEVDRTLSVSAKRSQIIGDNLRQVIDLSTLR